MGGTENLAIEKAKPRKGALLEVLYMEEVKGRAADYHIPRKKANFATRSMAITAKCVETIDSNTMGGVTSLEVDRKVKTVHIEARRTVKAESSMISMDLPVGTITMRKIEICHGCLSLSVLSSPFVRIEHQKLTGTRECA